MRSTPPCRTISSFNDKGPGADLQPRQAGPDLCPVPGAAPAPVNAYYDIKQVHPVDGSTWKLELGGLIKDKRPWTVQSLRRPAAARHDHPPRLRGGLGLYWRVVGGAGSATS